MPFKSHAQKLAFISTHDRSALVKSTPKEHGGKTPNTEYFVRFHPEESRWSCTCPDWQYRRKGLDGRSKKKHNCKHILSTIKDKKPWEVKTTKVPNKPKALEKKAFWLGFFKQADAPAGDGGSGFTGVGKGNIHSQKQQNEVAGTIETEMTDKTLLDRERNPRDFQIRQQGPEFIDEVTHVVY